MHSWKHVVTDLQSSGSEVYAGTGNGLCLEPHKHVCPQAIVHIVPVGTERTKP